MKFFLFIAFFICHLIALDFKVASYNVENFFDLHYDTTEYQEYIPHTKSWNQNSFTTKLHNISKTISDLDADILALQEIESQRVLQAIVKKNPQYTYHTFIKNKSSAIGLALMSKFPIKKTEKIVVNKSDKYARDILKVTLSIDNKPLIVYVNHWRSKRAKESKRIPYALALQKEIEALGDTVDYIILGDLNSDYNEYQTFKYNKNLNDTHNITGINQILNTTIDQNFVQKESLLDYSQKVHYNTWLELKTPERFSTKFKQQNNTPDHIILCASLFDDKNISYKNNSFGVFKKPYLFNKKYIYRWNKSKHNGYSDHLPIFASFSTKRQHYPFLDKKSPEKKNLKNKIADLYKVQNISQFPLENVTVIYKAKKLAILKQTQNGKAIMLYKPPAALKVGYSYNFTVDKIGEFNGLKEIISISNIRKKQLIKEYKKFYVDGNNIDTLDYELINNIVVNLQGVYKKGSLYTKNRKIKLYFKKGIKRPKDGTTISIHFGHLSIFHSTLQIVLHSEKDFRVLSTTPVFL